MKQAAPPAPLPPAAERVVAGTLVRIDGGGVLLTGESGSGKSDTALGLLDRGHALVADDAVWLSRREGRLWGRPPAGMEGLLCLRGLGIVEVTALFGPGAAADGAPVQLIVHLDPELRVYGLPAPAQGRTIMAARVPRLVLPTGRGRDLPLLVETAARAQALGQQGWRPQEEFSARQQRALARGAS